MDQRTQSHSIKTISPDIIINHPAHLLIGSPLALKSLITGALQKIFCEENGCTLCATCMHIQQNQHQSVMWFNPENQYTREYLEPVFHISSFVLEKNECFFFILEKADYFNQSCANSLLKLLEEPPVGYHFILLAQREEYILPTIRSRCLVTYFSSQESSEVNEITSWFMTLPLPDPATFAGTIDQANITNRESLEMLDILFEHWVKKHNEIIDSNDIIKTKKIKKIILILKKTLENPPMPGGSKLFWKDLFLQFQNIG
jgi:DNA polymerase III, delta subunit